MFTVDQKKMDREVIPGTVVNKISSRQGNDTFLGYFLHVISSHLGVFTFVLQDYNCVTDSFLEKKKKLYLYIVQKIYRKLVCIFTIHVKSK